MDAKQKMEEAALREQQQLADIEAAMGGEEVTSDGFDYTSLVNTPELKEGMIPITYNETKGEWEVADKSNPNKSWYDYDDKRWANICTVSDSVNNDPEKAYRTADVGTTIPEEDMTTMFVWIPKYAYSIVDGYQNKNANGQSPSTSPKIKVKFLVGNTNRDIDNKTYETDYNPLTDITVVEGKNTTPMIVHPGFTFGNNQLTGFWMAKFEASGTKIVDSQEVAVGNGNGTSNSQQYAPTAETIVKSLPSKISWRYITIGESQYRCMQMANNTSAYGWTNANTHLTKNSEWGAVAYLCYSDYGVIPKINGCATADKTPSPSYYYNYYTGMGPTSASSEARYDAPTTINGNEYVSENGQYASTTGNVYGVYDMSGGAWERVAAYLDNGNGNLSDKGNSSTKINNVPVAQYFNSSNELISMYSAYWDKYDVSTQEKSNSIVVDGLDGTLTQTQLWKKNKNENNAEDFTKSEVNLKYNTARKYLTDEIYSLLANEKGIGINEVSNTHSYYGVTSAGTYNWMLNAESTGWGAGTAWNSDYVLIGHASLPFFLRGGYASDGGNAGVVATVGTYGSAGNFYGFRPALCP